MWSRSQPELYRTFGGLGMRLVVYGTTTTAGIFTAEIIDTPPEGIVPGLR